MPCCVPKPDFDDFFTLKNLGYITMKIEMIADYKGLKKGQDVSDLPDAQKKVLLNIKAAKLTTTETKKDAKESTDNSKKPHTSGSKPKE